MVATRYANGNSDSLVSLPVAARYFPQMDRRTIRKNNLLLVIYNAGGLEAVAGRIDALPKKDSDQGRSVKKYLAQLATGFQGKRDARPRTPGDTLCKQIEAALQLSPGWMDLPHIEEWKKAGISTEADQSSQPPIQYTATSPRQEQANSPASAIYTSFTDRDILEVARLMSRMDAKDRRRCLQFARTIAMDYADAQQTQPAS